MSARTAARSALVLVALAIALAAGALLGIAASSTTADAVQPGRAVEAPAVVQAPDLSYGEPFLVALLGEGTGIPANADELILAADRTCEAISADVPFVTVTDTLVTQLGVTEDEARTFIVVAADIHCAR